MSTENSAPQEESQLNTSEENRSAESTSSSEETASAAETPSEQSPQVQASPPDAAAQQRPNEGNQTETAASPAPEFMQTEAQDQTPAEQSPPLTTPPQSSQNQSQESESSNTSSAESGSSASEVQEIPMTDVQAQADPKPIDEVTQQPETASEQAQAALEQQTEAPAPKKKVTLNPTATPQDARPVPSIGSETGEAEAVPSGPVELPTATDSDIEAEVSKALSGISGDQATAEASADTNKEGVALPQKEAIDASIEAAIEEALQTGGASSGDVEGGSATDVDELEPGQKLTGEVQSITGDNVFLDFGLRLSGTVPLRQFGAKKPPQPGDKLEVLFDQVDEDAGLILTRIPGGTTAVQSSDWSMLTKGQNVECLVKKTNKGGLEVTVGSLRGFIPASQIDIGFVEDMSTYVGQKLTAQITEVKPEKKNLVLSRRKILNAERAEARKAILEEIKPEEVRTGTVKTIKDYGAFVDLGGMDGFLPISQISWIRIDHPSDVISEGQEIEVKVLSVDREKKKVSLGMRQLTQNPWRVAEDKYEKGSTVSGRVTKTETFGAFVELEPGIEGLVHISELDHRRVKRVTEVLNVGDMAEVQVLDVDPSKKRISLSLKALKAKPEPVEKPRDEDLAPGQGQSYERKRKGPLKGGTGSSGGGGLFGNPTDFGG